MIQIPADIQSFPAFLIPTTLLSKTSKRVWAKAHMQLLLLLLLLAYIMMLILLQKKQRRKSWKMLLYSRMTWQQSLKLPRSLLTTAMKSCLQKLEDNTTRMPIPFRRYQRRLKSLSILQIFLSLDSHQQLHLKKLCHQLHKRHFLAHFQYGDQGPIYSMIPFSCTMTLNF